MYVTECSPCYDWYVSKMWVFDDQNRVIWNINKFAWVKSSPDWVLDASNSWAHHGATKFLSVQAAAIQFVLLYVYASIYTNQPQQRFDVAWPLD